MKIAFVIMRYGPDLSGGAEKYARQLAEHLAPFHEIEVLTTTAVDYLTWNPRYKEGLEEINGVRVRRFDARHPRNRLFCGALWRYLVRFPSPRWLQALWFRASGPYSDRFLSFLRESGSAYDLFVFFIYFSPFTLFALPLVGEKSLFVPLAHDEPSIRWSIFRELFNAPAGFIFNTPEERALVQATFPVAGKPHITSGMGVEIPPRSREEEFLEKFPGLKGRDYIVFVGRVSRSKKVPLLIDFFLRFCRLGEKELSLVLLGEADYAIPRNSRLVCTGFVSEELKYSCLRSARLLVNPSLFESFSIVLIEAWNMDIPVLVNGDCAVLKGQVERSGGGLFFTGFDTFARALEKLLGDRELAGRMALEGKRYAAEHYSWEVIEKKVTSFLEESARRSVNRE